ncbi:chemotaxis protein CheX [Jeotgalibacillus campisalis]|uniref:Chemotaxis protein CheX n=1 Tax=Jeotgalibacillus campisalis TaxID=220754 RepID=A0A0C2VVM1_9BACL|nr:chemotaxis protein CheX [Jeotgalibacillus campisalis]KIL48013.1 chemotaxis protein CheX [Jeotgalibacillus campisalis]
MVTSKVVTNTLNGTIYSIKNVIPLPVSIKKPHMLDRPYEQQNVGVMIGMTGDSRGQILIDGEKEAFRKLGLCMFGIELEDDMLLSFIGELGNMIAGSLAASISKSGVELDITPPAVISGKKALFGFTKAILLPFVVETVGEFTILLALQGHEGGKTYDPPAQVMR